jgi:hypothetical protein
VACPLNRYTGSSRRYLQHKPVSCRRSTISIKFSYFDPLKDIMAREEAREEGSSYPFSKPAMKSLCGPSGVKLVTRNQLVFWLSRGPELVATLYLRMSDPVLVATTSGESPSRPMRVIFANVEARLVVENARALIGSVRRRRKADILLRGRS